MQGQIQTPHVGDPTVTLRPVAPAQGSVATVDIYTSCGTPLGKPLLADGANRTVADGRELSLKLKKKLGLKDPVCAVERDATNQVMMTFPVVLTAAMAKPVPPPVLTVQQGYATDKTVRVTVVPPPPGTTATVDVFSTCPAGGAPGNPLNDVEHYTDVIGSDDKAVDLPLLSALAAGDSVCAVEASNSSAMQGWVLAPSESMVVIDLPSAPTDKAPSESFEIVGVSLSAASGASPQGKLFVELYGDTPFLGNEVWGFGYVRIGSISQSTSSLTLSQEASAATTALSSQNQQLVQSAELAAGLEFRLLPKHMKKADGSFSLESFSFVISGGATTPLSPASVQQSQQYYTVTSDVENYYTSGVYAKYLPNFQKLCPASINSTNTAQSGTACYVDFYPQDRSRFFRHYEAGFRIKTPMANNSFPATFDGLVGQNEYVTAGMMRGLVLHVGGVSPLPFTFTKGMFVFGGMDLGVTNSGDSPGPLMFAASSTANPAPSTSNSVNIVTPQPNRDRWLLGIGYDLSTVVQAMKKK